MPELGTPSSKDIEKYDTNKLVRLQVEQLDKEKRDLSERLRVLHKRIDHLERAYRKEEAPLLAEDYDRQQKEDRITHEKNVKTTLTAAKQKHLDDLDAKKRLARMTSDYQARRKEIAGKREGNFQSRRAEAQKLMEAEKEARRQEVYAERAAEKENHDAEERQRREEEEAHRRQEEGTCRRSAVECFDSPLTSRCAQTEEAAENERLLREQEAAAAAVEAQKKAEAEKAAAARAAREAERQKDLDAAKLRLQREEELEAKRQARRLEEKQRATSTPVPRSTNGDAPSIPASPSVGGWRSRVKESKPPTPPPPSSRPASGAYRPPGARSSTPSNGAARSETPPLSGRPSIFGSGRAREEVSATPPPRPSPFGNAQPVDRPAEKEKIADSNEFRPAPATGKWKPRIRGSGEAPPR